MSTIYKERERAVKDLSKQCDQISPSGDLKNLLYQSPDHLSTLSENKNYNRKADDIIAIESLRNSINDEAANKEIFEKTYGQVGPMLKNPVQKYVIEDSSDEELVQDTKDRINLAGKNLEAIPSSIAARAKEVKFLTLTNNQMKFFEQLSMFTSLETLVLDKNNLKSIKGLPKIETLKTLWLNNNQIDNFDMLLFQVKQLFPNLEYLSLLRNPINPAVYFGTENEKPYQRFRRRILQELPNLRVIDTQDVTKNEREDAKRQPKYLIARPSQDEEENSEDDEPRGVSFTEEKIAPAAFIGTGKLKYDGRDSEGNRFITNLDL